MPTPTPDQGITLPVGGDLAAVVTAMQNAIATIETRLNLRYANAADRTARHPVGVEGESSDLAAENWADSFDGSAWISRTARGYRGMKILNADATAINSGTTGIGFVNDPTLVVPLEAAGSFAFGGLLFYDTPTAADMKMTFTWPGAPTASRWGATGRDATTTTNVAQSVVIVSGTAAVFGGLGAGTPAWVAFDGYIRNTGVAGNLQLQYAQNVADAGNFTVRAGSRLWVLKTS
jgi:hypothetical protein